MKQVRENQILYDLRYVQSKKKKIKLIDRTDWWLPEVGGGEWVKWAKVAKRYKLLVIR